MGINIDAKKAIELSGYNGQFKESLKDIIKWASKDPNITSIDQLAYILATAKIESGYSLQRWESDYLCGKQGQPYFIKPCQSALNYYRSTDGKKDYYQLGVDPKGLPYFGRGLIQLTGKGNYAAYAKRLNIDLVNNPDLALKPKNSYRIAVSYMHHRGTFDKISQGDLYGARRTIGSGGKTNEVTQAYHQWVSILKQSEKKKLFSISKPSKPRTPEQKQAIITGTSIISAVLVVGVAVLIVRKLVK